MVEGGRLESVCTRNGTGGSNPSLTANLQCSIFTGHDISGVIRRLGSPYGPPEVHQASGDSIWYGG